MYQITGNDVSTFAARLTFIMRHSYLKIQKFVIYHYSEYKKTMESAIFHCPPPHRSNGFFHIRGTFYIFIPLAARSGPWQHSPSHRPKFMASVSTHKLHLCYSSPYCYTFCCMTRHTPFFQLRLDPVGCLLYVFKVDVLDFYLQLSGKYRHCHWPHSCHMAAIYQ